MKKRKETVRLVDPKTGEPVHDATKTFNGVDFHWCAPGHLPPLDHTLMVFRPMEFENKADGGSVVAAEEYLVELWYVEPGIACTYYALKDYDSDLDFHPQAEGLFYAVVDRETVLKFTTEGQYEHFLDLKREDERQYEPQ